MNAWLYLIGGAIVAVASLFFSERFTSEQHVNHAMTSALAVAAGVLWPLILVGVGQLAIIMFLIRKPAPVEAE